MAFAVMRPVVLIFEDEPLLRMNAVEMIEEAGFDVVASGSADEAIAILARSQARYPHRVHRRPNAWFD
jgi:CheY-like chemotaxis protein